MAFAEALVGDHESLAEARARVAVLLGPSAAVEAAGVASNFQRMVRIADATGIPLGEDLERFSEDVRAELDLEWLRRR